MASLPLKYAQRHRLQVKMAFQMFMENDTTISITIKYAPLSHRIGGNKKHSELSLNADQKSLEIVFSIAICRQSGDH